jgi:NAD(P)H-hydrate epimerase
MQVQIVSGKQMAELEKRAIEEGCSSEAFMESAGIAIAEILARLCDEASIKKIVILCGKGNNAGDGYTAGSYLLKRGFTALALQLFPLDKASKLCRLHASHFLELGGIIQNELPEDISDSLIVDAIFGTGFTGTMPDSTLEAIDWANGLGKPIVAIDIPSGLDSNSGIVEQQAIRANATIYLGAAKKGYFLRQGFEHVGKLIYADFGMPKIEQDSSDWSLATDEYIHTLLPQMKRQRNKYNAGTVLVVGGMMAGATILSSSAALRVGAGLVTLAHPTEADLAQLPPEIIRMAYNSSFGYEDLLKKVEAVSAVAIGPGLGRSEEAKSLLVSILGKIRSPCVIDADGLTLLSEEKEFIFPEQAVVTPHLGELSRLLKREKISSVDEELLEQCQAFVQKHRCTLLIKGAPTFILHSERPITVSPYGDPGMATAGSGDVLTGMIAGLLAEKTEPYEAAILAAALHGIAGEFAAAELSSYYMNASDILTHLPAAFHRLEGDLK